MTVVARRVFFAVVGTVIVLAGLGLGILAGERITLKPNKDFGFAVEDVANGVFTTFAKQIDGAKTVYVCARQVGSKNVLEALQHAAERGAEVRVLLDRSSIPADASGHPDLRVGAVGFFRAHSVGELRLSEDRIYDQMLVIDRTLVFLTATPWTLPSTTQEGAAPVYMVRNRAAAAQILQRFDRLWERATPAPAL